MDSNISYVKFDIVQGLIWCQICHMPLNKDELKIIFGNRIRQIRHMKKLTIEKVANEAGIEYVQLSRIEHGKINTSIYQAYIISQSLGVEITDLFSDISIEK